VFSRNAIDQKLTLVFFLDHVLLELVLESGSKNRCKLEVTRAERLRLLAVKVIRQGNVPVSLLFITGC
jgi:hypothetical protein